MSSSKSERYDGQGWFLNRMAAMGYQVERDQSGRVYGHCFGMSNMSMQAFLANDMKSFHRRLQLINSIPIEAFKNDFADLRAKQKELMAEGKTDEANQINQDIVDITAFFDGMAIYQAPRLRPELFSNPEGIQGQNAKASAELARPLAFDSEKTRPELLNTHSGAYSKKELATYFSTLEEHLGQSSFALGLSAEGHAINVNYDAQNKCWILLDPNHLPEKKYTDVNALSAELISNFQPTIIFTQGLVLETSLYTRHSDAKALSEGFTAMEKTEAWKTLQQQDKLNTHYGNGLTQLEYALRRKDTAWIKEKIPLGLDNVKSVLGFALTMGDIELLDEIIKSGVNPNSRFIEKAIGSDSMEVVKCLSKHNILSEKDIILVISDNRISEDMMNLILDHGMKPTQKMLNEAISSKNIDAMNSLMKHGVEPDKDELKNAVLSGNLAVVQCLVENGVKHDADDSLIFVAILSGSPDVLSYLLEIGSKPTPDDLKYACSKQNITLIQRLLNHGVVPTESMLKDAYRRNHVDVLNLLIDSGLSLTDNMRKEVFANQKPEIVQGLLKGECSEGRIRLIEDLVKNKSITKNDIFSAAFTSENLSGNQLLPKAAIKMAIQDLNIKRELKSLGLRDERINAGLDVIADKVLKTVQSSSPLPNTQQAVRDAVLTELNNHVSDKSSVLGSKIQRHTNTRFDKYLDKLMPSSIVPKKFAAFKEKFHKQFDELKERKPPADTVDKQASDEAEDENTPKLQ